MSLSAHVKNDVIMARVHWEIYHEVVHKHIPPPPRTHTIVHTAGQGSSWTQVEVSIARSGQQRVLCILFCLFTFEAMSGTVQTHSAAGPSVSAYVWQATLSYHSQTHSCICSFIHLSFFFTAFIYYFTTFVPALPPSLLKCVAWAAVDATRLPTAVVKRRNGTV